MIISLIVEVFIKAFLLLILLYIVARDEADFEFRKVVMVTAAITLGGVIIEATLTRHIGLWTLVPVAALIVFMIMKFCWVGFWRALLVAVPFLILNAMIATAVFSFNEKANKAVAKGLQGPVTEEDMKEAMLFYKQSFGDSDMELPFEKKKEIKIEPNMTQLLLETFSALFSSNKFAAMMMPGEKNRAGMPSEQSASGDSKHIVKMPFTGGRPEEDGAVLSSAGWQEAENKLTLSGVLVGRDGVRVAVINDQMIKEGEFIQVGHGRMTYRWRARLITERGVSWERVEALKK